jgi:RNase adaptor protein for sRNA GlmZ degradation
MEDTNEDMPRTVTQYARSQLILEIGGTNKSSKPSALPPSAVVIDAAKLPNPYTPLNRKTLEISAPKIVEWMAVKSPQANDHIAAMVEHARAAFSAQRSVRVECYGGAHRSQAVAWKILESLDELSLTEVAVVCVDCDPLPELAPHVVR